MILGTGEVKVSLEEVFLQRLLMKSAVYVVTTIMCSYSSGAGECDAEEQ